MSHGDPENRDFDPMGPRPEPASPPSEPIPMPPPEKKASTTPPPRTGGPPPSPPQSQQPAAEPLRRSGPLLFPILAAVVLAGLLGAAWYFGMGPGAGGVADMADAGMPTEPADIFASNPGDAPEPPAPADPTPELETLKADFQALSERLGTMQASLDARSDDGPAADQETLDTLKTLPGVVQEMAETLTALGERLATVEGSAATAREETASLQQQVQELRGQVAASATSEPAAAGADTDTQPALAGERLGQVATLFAARQYAEAQPILRELRETSPEDARVWYYSALANGFVSGNWEDETIALVRQGVQRERAGTPETSVIDTTFSDLPSGTQTWLEYYRRQGR